MKIANIDTEDIHISWKMLLLIILKLTKKQVFIIFLEDTFLEKPQGAFKLTPSLLRSKKMIFNW